MSRTMLTLKNKLAEYGFDSPQHHDYAVQSFLGYPTEQVRCLNIEGDAGRRRTAFAHALAQALDTQQVLYFEFGVEPPAPKIVRVEAGEDLPSEPPTSAFDRAMTEACALSEAETTVLILDQLHKAPFREHIRLYEFVRSNVWTYSDVRLCANVSNLQIYLISAEPVYHSLQQQCFRIWVSATSPDAGFPSLYEAGLDEGCAIWLEPLHELLEQLGVSPSLQQYQRLTYDLLHRVRNPEQLRQSLFGWIEQVDYNRLATPAMQPLLARVMQALLASLEIQEEIELAVTLVEPNPYG